MEHYNLNLSDEAKKNVDDHEYKKLIQSKVFEK